MVVASADAELMDTEGWLHIKLWHAHLSYTQRGNHSPFTVLDITRRNLDMNAKIFYDFTYVIFRKKNN